MVMLSRRTAGSLCPVLTKLLPYSTVSTFHIPYTILRRSIQRSISLFLRSRQRLAHGRAPQSLPPQPPTARNRLI
eukprot:1485543-Pleurochrysis_carterae.AAC.1